MSAATRCDFSGEMRRPWRATAERGLENAVSTFPSSPCRHNQQNMAVLCRHVVTSTARGGTFGVGGEWKRERFPAPPCHISNPARWRRRRRRRPPQPRPAGAAFIVDTAAVESATLGVRRCLCTSILRDFDVGVPAPTLHHPVTPPPICNRGCDCMQGGQAGWQTRRLSCSPPVLRLR